MTVRHETRDAMRGRRRFGVVLGLAALALLLGGTLGGPAQAGIIGTAGQVQVLPTPPPPSNLSKGQFTNNTNASLFTEQTSFVLPSPVAVDITSPGPYDSSHTTLTPGTIPAGTRVNDYLFHADSTSSRPDTYTGSITFDTPVLGLIVLEDSLADSDPILGDPGVTYPSADRVLHVFDGDSLTLSPDMLTVDFTIRAKRDGGVPEFRIITAAPAPAVPEPSSLALLSLGGLGLAGWRRWKRRG